VEYSEVVEVVVDRPQRLKNQNQLLVLKGQHNLKKRLAQRCVVQSAEAVNSCRMHV
jgi:hypothetical protein